MITSEVTPSHNQDSRDKLIRLFNVFIPVSISLGALAGVLIVVFNQPVYILMGLAGLGVFIAALYYVEFGLIVLIFISYTRFSDVIIEFHGLPSIAKPYLVLLVISILLRWALFRDPPKRWEKPALLFGALSLAGFASLIYSPFPESVMARILDDIKDIIIALVVVILLRNNHAFRRTIWTLIVVAVFLGSLSVLQYVTGTFEQEYGGFAVSQSHQIIGVIDDYRATGPIGDPNFFAQIMVVLAPISLERFLHEKRMKFRLFAFWGMVASILTVILTYSRGGLLAMLVGLIVIFLVYPPRRFQVPFIILGAAIFIFLLPPNYLDRLFTLSAFFGSGPTTRIEERSLQGRLSENLAAWEMVKSNPLFGVGLSSFKYLFPEYSKKQGLALVATEREAHNMFLEVAAETGLIGFLIFSLLLVVSFKTVVNARRYFLDMGMLDYAGMATSLLAGLVGYFVAALFVHNAFPRYFYLLLGIAFSLSYVKEGIPANSVLIKGKK